MTNNLYCSFNKFFGIFILFLAFIGLSSIGCNISSTVTKESVEPIDEVTPSVSTDTPSFTFTPVSPELLSTVTATQAIIPTPTATLTPTALSMPIPEGRFIYLDEKGINITDLDTGDIGLLATPSITGSWIRDAVFSPDKRWVAYWEISPNFTKLFLQEAENNEATFVHTFENNIDQIPYMFWSGDSLHLFIVFEPASDPLVLDQSSSDPIKDRSRFILSIETMEVQQWNWECDRIAQSPQTDRIVMWCPSLDPGEASFAVIEWKDEIWYTKEAPDIFLKARNPEFILPSWVWSKDGRRVVYPEDSLSGTSQFIIAAVNSGQIMTETLNVEQTFISNLGLSNDNLYISFLGRCMASDPCLVVLNIESNDVAWTSEDLGSINRGLNQPIWHGTQNLIMQPSFVDSKYVLLVIDPFTQSIVWENKLTNKPVFGIDWLP